MTRLDTHDESRAQALLGFLHDWGRLIALALAAALLVGGFVMPRMGAIEASVILLGFPLVVLGVGAVIVEEETRGAVRALGLLVLLAALLLSGARSVQVVWPPAPYGAVSLGQGARGGGGDLAAVTPGAGEVANTANTIDVPADASALEVTVHADLGQRDSAWVHYGLVLERAGKRAFIHGELSRQVQAGQGASRWGGPSTSVRVHATEMHALSLPGPGPIRVEVDRLVTDTPTIEPNRQPHRQPDGHDDGPGHPVSVTVAPVPAGVRALELGLVLLVGAALLVQVVAARRGRRVLLTSMVAAAAVFALAAGRWFNPDSPLMFAMGVALLGGSAGGLGGWIVGAVAVGIVAPRPRPGPGSPPVR